MKENKKSKLGLGILIGLLVAIIIGLTGFIIYDKVLGNDNNKEVELNYEIVPMPDELFKYAGKLLVNNKDTGLISVSLDETDIYKLNDALIVEINNGIFSIIYVIDKDANIINKFHPGCYDFCDDDYYKDIKQPYISLKGELDSYTVNGNDVYIKGHMGQDDEAVVCSNSDDYIIEYTEKFAYLGNGKFTTPTIVNPVTVKEYKEIHNIQCR